MTKKTLLTGGSGDLGSLVAKAIDAAGDTAIRLDVRPPVNPQGVYVAGSILDRDVLAGSLQGVSAVVHIAAWHGIHEFKKQKDVYDFWDLNVTGTFYVFEAAARAGIRQMVYISSTSVEERDGVYGHTKVLGEEIARTYAARHGMSVITLRPRAFIPHWNKDVYGSFIEWARWFWPGAVHIHDVVQGVMNSLDLLKRTELEEHITLTLDGAYEYSDEDLRSWDEAGTGSTFRKYYAAYEALVQGYELDPTVKPTRYDMSETQRWLGYQPAYSLKNLLQELEQFGTEGPPSPLA